MSFRCAIKCIRTKNIRQDRKRKMHPSHVINAIFLCLLNVSFLVAGFILNSVVIISLWRSSTLINKKNLCYFMILILSCSDLAVVAMVHPLLILSTIRWSLQMYTLVRDHFPSKFFNVCTVNVKYLTIPGYNASIFSPNHGFKRKTCTFSSISNNYSRCFNAFVLW